jgi:ssDNA-binding Zn-finger/Zn-ribbon topoisomerase 1
MTGIIIYAITAVVFVFIFSKATKNKSKWGINLKRVYCPVCGTKQPIVRWPKNQQQFLWGGTTCPKCHANLDKYGNVIP